MMSNMARWLRISLVIAGPLALISSPALAGGSAGAKFKVYNCSKWHTIQVCAYNYTDGSEVVAYSHATLHGKGDSKTLKCHTSKGCWLKAAQAPFQCISGKAFQFQEGSGGNHVKVTGSAHDVFGGAVPGMAWGECQR